MADPILDLAREIHKLKQNMRALGSSPQLQYSSFEDGAIRGFSGDQQVMQIGLQWDGTYVPAVTNGPVPPTPSSPVVQDATEGLIISWDGSFVGGLIPTPMDFLRVDAHVGATSDFIPDHTNRRATFASPQGGYASITLPYGTYFVKLVCWTLAGKVSLASSPVEGDSWPVEVSSDGFAPASSPAVELIGGWEMLVARWSGITNPDPVEYVVHVSTVDGFTPDSTTQVGVTVASQFTIKQLPGTPPANPSDPDPRKLQYGVTYYVKIVARDADGSAAPGVQDSASIFQVPGQSIADATIVAGNIVAGTLTGDLFAASIVLAGAFKTAETGQRTEMTPLGFFSYKPDGSVMLSLPNTGEALFDGEFIVRGATVLGGLSIQSDQNEITADGVLTLMRGIQSPTSSPQFATTYEYVTPSTITLTAGQKTNNDPQWGLGGPFDLVPSQVSFIEWRSALNCWSVYQVRSNGTREWYFHADGTPKDIWGNGTYCSDFKNWEIWSATEIQSSSIAGMNGHFLMFRYMPSPDVYYVSAPDNIYRYSRQNGLTPPVIGNNGEQMFVAEVVNTDDLRIRYFTPVGGSASPNMPAATSQFDSPAGYTPGTPLCTVQHHTGFDVAGGGARYLVAERGNGSMNRILYPSGSALYPHGTTAGTGAGQGWNSVNKEAGSFEAANSSRRCVAWDGTQFWTYSGDGNLYKHTSERWDPAVTSSVLWGSVTFYDSDVAGTGTHETTPGDPKSFTHKRRARIRFTPPSIPDTGDPDDPDKIRLYVGRGSSQPTNANMFLQSGYSGTGTYEFVTLVTGTANPPLVNTFPIANPAMIRSDDDGLQIKGDATVRAVQFKVGAVGSTPDNVAIEGPCWLGYLSSAPAIPAADTLTPLQGWTVTESNGITLAAGVFTMPRGGVYRFTGQLWYAAVASSTSTRLGQIRRTSAPATTIQSQTIDAKASGAPSIMQFDKEFRLPAGATVVLQISWPAAAAATANRVPTATSEDISFLQIRYVSS